MRSQEALHIVAVATVMAGVILSTVLLAVFAKRRISAAPPSQGWRPTYSEMCVIWVGLSVLWWTLAGGLEYFEIARLAGTSAIGLAFGATVGFLFTSYEDESDSVGRVRNWLLGGLTSISIAEVATGAKNIDAAFTFITGVTSMDMKAIHASALIGYSVLGFFGSFILREVWLNLVFAKARRERRDVASAIDSARDAVKTATDSWSQHIAQRGDGDAPDPATFESAVKVVDNVEAWKSASFGNDKNAILVIARSYTVTGRYAAAAGAFERIIERTGYQDATIEGALVAYERLNAYSAATALVERFGTELGGAADQWLGYYLLYDPKRAGEAAAHGERFLNGNPNNDGAMFNLACAYAQKFAADENAPDKDAALAWLLKAAAINKQWLTRAKELCGWADDFYALRKDADFLKVIQ